MSRSGWSFVLVVLIGCASRQRTLPSLPPPPPAEDEASEDAAGEDEVSFEPDYSELPPPPEEGESAAPLGNASASGALRRPHRAGGERTDPLRLVLCRDGSFRVTDAEGPVKAAL